MLHRISAYATIQSLEKLGLLGRLLEMVEEFESSWRTLTPGRTGYLLQTSPFDGILGFTKMVKPEARGHVEMLHAAKIWSEAILVAQ